MKRNKNASDPTKCYKTRLPSDLRPTTRECVHLVTRGRFQSRDNDGDHTVQSAIAKEPHATRNLMAPCSIKADLLLMKFYIAEIGIFGLLLLRP